MKVKNKTFHYDSGPNMTPLVDVVMVILIFLMLAGSFGNSEHFLFSKNPIGAGSPGAVLPAFVDVYVASNGNASMLPDLKNEPDVDRVRDALQKKMRSLAQINTGRKDFSVELVFHSSPRTKWSSLAPLYDAAVRADCRNIAFTKAE